MGKLFYTLLCLFVGITASASQITEQQARQVAAKYAGIDVNNTPKRMKAAGKQQTAAYYAFNIGDNEGFVIVSGDDSLTELVGYSDSGSFDPDNIPGNMRWWLQAYSDYVASVQAGESKAKRQQLGNVTTIVVRPLVTTKWNQFEPFNGMAPIENGERCVTGCVATAMAQIMNYYEWPERGEGSHSYTDNSGHSLSADFSQSVYDWGNMLDEYNSYYDYDYNIVYEYNDAQANAVAKLMLDCGISVDMDYTLSSSAAYTSNVVTALEEYFNYTADLFYRDNMPSENFMGKLLEELDNRRPVLFSGRSTKIGHTFVADGYDSNNFVHINWGWGGNSNGYFNINYLDSGNPGIEGGTGGFNYSQDFITSYPNFTGVPQETEQMSLAYFNGSIYGPCIFISSLQFQQSQQQTVSLASVYNPNVNDYSGEIGVAAFDAEGNMTMVHTSPQQINIPAISYHQGLEFLSDFSVLTDGEYQVCGISRQNPDEREYDWIKFDSKYCLDIRVANGIVTVAPEYSLSLAKQIEKPEKIYIGQTAEFVATLHNNSSLTAEGTIDYEVRRLSDNGVVYSSSIEAIVYDGNDYSTMLSVPVESSTFDYSETYSIAITGFTLYSGKTIPVESGFGQCTFLVDCHRLSFYDYKDDCGISLVVDQFKKTEPQDVMFKYVYNIDTRNWFNGDISAAICDKNGEIILYFSDYYTLSLNPGRVDNIIRTMENFTPDMSELADGMYSIIPLLRAEGDTEWVRFDHPSKIDIEIKGDYAYVQNYIFCISQESDFTPSGDFNVGDNAMFNVKIRNNGKEQAIGKLHYEIWKQPDNRFVYCDDEQIYIPAYSTEDIVIISNYYTFEEEGTYTIALVSYKPSTDYHHSFSTTYSPYAFNVGEAGVEKIDADSVAVYPNPVEDYVTVECNDVAAVRIYSASGQLVKSVGGTDAEGSIYVGDLPAGYYIVAVDTESGATVRKQILKR